MHRVTPRSGDVFYLRMLLLHVRGATSFDDLKILNGTIPLQNKFKDVCKWLGILQDDKEWECLNEAVLFAMPKQLRELFVFICVFNHPFCELDLWNLYKLYLCEDFIHQNNNDEIIGINYGLYEISKTVQLYGKSCESYGLPSFDSKLILNDSSGTQFI